ncbi:SDR family oxidoreductase [Acidisoma cellulosilytica]|uniref:SDR family oxidoreductase n=1 Tax=Acidisoma cellulosilyticum TaxID=2802395 RepID=A0A963Z500_9PROT|nr:SDR family oxidoreductase [Acidisoma cellulosilyticum]
MTWSGRFDGRCAIITGAANGIGEGCARRLALEGARIAVVDQDAALPSRFADLPSDQVFAAVGDCTDARFLEAFVRDAEAKLGVCDTLINNLGRSARERGSPFLESEEAVWRFVLEISLMVSMRMTRLVAGGMKALGYGRIINIISDAAMVGDVGLADYATAKMGLVGFTRVLARELAAHGVTVNAVGPGAVRTLAQQNMPPHVTEQVRASTPVGFIAEPEDIAGLVAYLGSKEARFITGQTILIDGGRWMI